MSSKSEAKSPFSGKSPYGNSAQRGRGGLLKITVVILVLAALAWTFMYARAVATAPAGANTQGVDPSAVR